MVETVQEVDFFGNGLCSLIAHIIPIQKTIVYI